MISKSMSLHIHSFTPGYDSRFAIVLRVIRLSSVYIYRISEVLDKLYSRHVLTISAGL